MPFHPQQPDTNLAVKLDEIWAKAAGQSLIELGGWCEQEKQYVKNISAQYLDMLMKLKNGEQSIDDLEITQQQGPDGQGFTAARFRAKAAAPVRPGLAKEVAAKIGAGSGNGAASNPKQPAVPAN